MSVSRPRIFTLLGTLSRPQPAHDGQRAGASEMPAPCARLGAGIFPSRRDERQLAFAPRSVMYSAYSSTPKVGTAHILRHPGVWGTSLPTNNPAPIRHAPQPARLRVSERRRSHPHFGLGELPTLLALSLAPPGILSCPLPALDELRAGATKVPAPCARLGAGISPSRRDEPTACIRPSQ